MGHCTHYIVATNMGQALSARKALHVKQKLQQDGQQNLCTKCWNFTFRWMACFCCAKSVKMLTVLAHIVSFRPGCFLDNSVIIRNLLCCHHTCLEQNIDSMQLHDPCSFYPSQLIPGVSPRLQCAVALLNSLAALAGLIGLVAIFSVTG